MEDNGTLQLFWEQHIEYQSTLGKSCTDKSNIEGISRRRLSNNLNSESTSTKAKANDTDSERLSLREMAGTFLGENGIFPN